MRRGVAGAVVLLVAIVARAEDESNRATVEVIAQRESVYAGEVMELSVCIRYEEAFFREQAVPLFSRKTDLPFHLSAPWLVAVRGMERVAPLQWPLTTATIAVGDDVEDAVRGVGVKDRKPSLTVTRAFVAREPGEVTLVAPELRFAYATKFEDDFIDGRRGVDRHDVVVRGQPLVLHVLALPAEGRPPSFGGAVGRMLSIVASSTLQQVSVGETFRLELTFSGEGHLASFDAPRLDGLAGFHVYGVLDDHGASVRKIAYDVAALDASVREIPPIEWAYFNTLSIPSYRVLKTTPIPLTVRPAYDSKSAASPSPTAADKSTWVWAAIAVCAAAFVASVAWIASRRGGREAPDPAQARRAAAAAAVRTAAASGRDAGAEFTEYLAARLGCAPAAVVGADLASRLASAGVPEALARRAAAAHDALVASRYGGSGAPTAADLTLLVDEMESAPTEDSSSPAPA